MNKKPKTDRYFLFGENEHLAGRTHGAWLPKEDFFADRMLGDGEQYRGAITDVHSVPSVLARPIIFFHALKDLKHPLHTAVTKEWRGLLGCLALAQTAKLELETSEFVLQGIETEGAEKMLRNVLYRQLPRLSGNEKPEKKWLTWKIFTSHKRLIGASSPWTVVFTPAEYVCPEVVPWRIRESGLLGDPTAFYADLKAKNGEAELASLLEYVDKLIPRRDNTTRKNTYWGLDQTTQKAERDTLSTELNAWRDDIIKALQSKGCEVPAEKGNNGGSAADSQQKCRGDAS